MGKLSIVTDNSRDPEKLKISVSDRRIYYGDVAIIEGSLRYRPLHCSELENRLAHRDWNKSETLFISEVEGEGNEDDPILRYRKYTTTKPTGEIDKIDTKSDDPSLSFPLCGVFSKETKEKIYEAYNSIFDSIIISQGDVYMQSSKNIVDTKTCQESINLVTGLDSYTSAVNLQDLIEYSSSPGIKARVNLNIQYSKVNVSGSEAVIYSYHTIFDAFEYTEDRNLVLPGIIEVIGDNLIRLEYFGGTIRLFPISPSITEYIINNCTVIYGNFN